MDAATRDLHYLVIVCEAPLRGQRMRPLEFHRSAKWVRQLQQRLQTDAPSALQGLCIHKSSWAGTASLSRARKGNP